ncbi:MAG: hypothetical protein U1F24_16505 [Alphaproteobacteria bacterium]
MSAVPLTFVGHPFASTGVGEQIRSHVRAAAAIHLEPMLYDMFGYSARTDRDHIDLARRFETPALPGGIRVFHINGDEVDAVERKLAERGASLGDGYNVVVPAWELPVYPAHWARALGKFDEVWALSHFIADSLKAAGLPSVYIGQSVEHEPRALLPRRHFGLRESAFVFLHFFDTTSYATRKNPQAVLDLYRRLRVAHPMADIQLALKVKTADTAAPDWKTAMGGAGHDVVLFDSVFSAYQTQSLIAACDCFVSLHRSEGFGRGLGEAMSMGRIALGTNWSGNTDFMTAENSILVDVAMIPVGKGEYPEGEGQSWADPDIDHAFRQVDGLWDDAARRERLSANARTAALVRAGHKAVGKRILDRANAIAAKINAA